MKKLNKKHCAGCHNNFYNGNNPYGVKECWSLATATLVKAKDVPVDMRPPYTGLPLTTRPNCYKEKGYCRVKPEALTKDGFWKS